MGGTRIVGAGEQKVLSVTVRTGDEISQGVFNPGYVFVGGQLKTPAFFLGPDSVGLENDGGMSETAGELGFVAMLTTEGNWQWARSQGLLGAEILGRIGGRFDRLAIHESGGSLYSLSSFKDVLSGLDDFVTDTWSVGIDVFSDPTNQEPFADNGPLAETTLDDYGQESTLELAFSISPSEDTILEFWHFINHISSGLAFAFPQVFPACQAQGLLEVSLDGRMSWYDITAEIPGENILRNRNRFLSGGYRSSFRRFRDSWCGNLSEDPTTLSRVQVDLSDYVGHDVHIRWRHTTNEERDPDWRSEPQFPSRWFIDDISIIDEDSVIHLDFNPIDLDYFVSAIAGAESDPDLSWNLEVPPDFKMENLSLDSIGSIYVAGSAPRRQHEFRR